MRKQMFHIVLIAALAAPLGACKTVHTMQGGGPPQWLSTHPSSETRIRDLTDYLGRVMSAFEAARRR